MRISTRPLVVAITLSACLGSIASAQLIRQPNNTLQLSETSPPLTLSATGAFADLGTLTPQPGIVPYEPNVPFWSDYAQKTRWFCIPNLTDTITFSADGNWGFPKGMVWVKHFDLPLERTDPNGPRRRIETRFLVKSGPTVYGLTYKWRGDQTEADLVNEYGEDVLFNVTVNGQPIKQVWSYPSRDDCVHCHRPLAGGALSMNTRQMNASHVYGTQTLNQIAALSGAGYFSLPVNHNNLPAFAKATQTTQSLEWRVRSYFGTNCIQCHQPGGLTGAMWDARATTPTDSANIINGLLTYDWGDPKDRFIVPGDLGHSIGYQALVGELFRMPPLATHEVDPGAIQLVQDWIVQSLPARRSFEDWQIQYFGSTMDPRAAPEADPDYDGHKNLEEYFAYTDPTLASSAPALPQSVPTGGGSAIQIGFTQPANRSALVESSADLVNWSPWDVPGNAPAYPAITTQRAITTPRGAEARRYFRVRLSAP